LVWRKDYAVNYRAIEGLELSAFRTICGVDEFQVACEAIAAESGGTTTPAILSGILVRWLGDDLLVRA
jgi:hypothetical protein